MASRSLDDLDSRLRPLAEQVISDCESAGVPVTIITTLRSEAEQADEIARHQSWTAHSKHLPQPPEGKSLAIDLAPTACLDKPDWAPTDPTWWTIAMAGVRLGLRSGMDWSGAGLPPVGQPRPFWDAGHLELDV